MPILEFKCKRGHISEYLFLTFAGAERAYRLNCRFEGCYRLALRILSVPGLPILYGSGFSKPAASGKLQTVGRDVTKVVAEENIKVTTQDGVQFGRPHLEKAKKISKQIRRSRRG